MSMGVCIYIYICVRVWLMYMQTYVSVSTCEPFRIFQYTCEYLSMCVYIISIHVYAIVSYLRVFTDCSNASCHSRIRDLRCPRWLLLQRQHLLSGSAEREAYAAQNQGPITLPTIIVHDATIRKVPWQEASGMWALPHMESESIRISQHEIGGSGRFGNYRC